MKNEKHLKKVVPINTKDDGTSRTIKAQYYKNGFVNFFIGGDYGATGVLECREGGISHAREKLKLHFNMSDQVNHPSHYLKNGRECIDVMIEKFGPEAVINFCECNEFKYLWRAGLKEGNSADQDLAKAEWYRKKAEELKNAHH